MSEQQFLPFEELEWSWEAWRPLPVGRWLPGDAAGYVWHRDRADAERAARRPFWRGKPFYKRTRLVCRPIGG